LALDRLRAGVGQLLLQGREPQGLRKDRRKDFRRQFDAAAKGEAERAFIPQDRGPDEAKPIFGVNSTEHLLDEGRVVELQIARDLANDLAIVPEDVGEFAVER
jgi:hypothetical protein